MANIIRIGSVELTEEEALRMYEKKLYIVTYSNIFELHYSDSLKRVCGRQIYHEPGLARRGRFHAISGEAVNRLVRFPLVKLPGDSLDAQIAAAEQEGHDRPGNGVMRDQGVR